MKHINLFFVFLIVFFGNISAQNKATFDLNGAIAYALNHNYNHQKQLIERAITYEKTNEVLTMGFPKLNGTVGYRNNFQLPTTPLPGEVVGRPGTLVPVQFGTQHNADISLSLQQLIFDGRYLVGVQARKSLKSLADKQIAASEQTLRELVSKSFYQYLALEKSIKMLEENETILSKLLDDTKKTYKEGLIEELDVERLEYNYLNLKNIIITTKNQQALAKEAVKFNIGYPMDSIIYLVGNIESDEIKSTISPNIQSIDISQKPEYQILEENLNIKSYDLKQNQAGYLPSLYGSAAYGWQAFRNQFNFFSGGDWFNYGNFGIALNVPIFDGFTKKHQTRQAKLALEKAKFEMQEYQQVFKIQTNQAFINLQNALNELEYNENLLKLSQKIQTKTQIKYKEGIGSSYEFAQAQNDRIQQQIKTIQSLLNLAIKKIEWQKAIGKL